MLDNTPSKPTKFRTKCWIEINDDSRGTYKVNSQTKLKTSMLRSSDYSDYSDAYTIASGTIQSQKQEEQTQTIQKYNNEKLCSIY